MLFFSDNELILAGGRSPSDWMHTVEKYNIQTGIPLTFILAAI
jgi:hypothetical protein